MLAINTPTYKLAKFLVPILKPLTSNEYAVKHSMLNKILNSLMGNQDVDFLFINISLEKAIDIFANTFLKILKKLKVYQKWNLTNFYLLLQQNLILYLAESSTSKPIESLWVHL